MSKFHKDCEHNMEIEKYFELKKGVYVLFITYMEETDEYDAKFNKLIDTIQKQKILEDKEEFEHFLLMILNFATNHHRTPESRAKVEKILLHYRKEIKQSFTNIEIFDIFSNNKLILLYLIKKNIIKIDEYIADIILNTVDYDGTQYCHFFLPEIKKFLDSEKLNEVKQEILNLDPTIPDNFDEKRQKGENDSKICSMIREDSIDDFIKFVNSQKIPINSYIKHSIFETHSYLIENKPSLIEYAAFFGSIQIFQYLKYNQIELTPSLWLYSIHGNNPEMIHLLEEYDVTPENDEECFLESVKCHNNNISVYIMNNKLSPNKHSDHFKDDVISHSFKYSNYLYIPTHNFDNNVVFFNSCFYNYSKVVFCYLGMKKDKIQKFIQIFFMD